jgi:hypothetical protein
MFQAKTSTILNAMQAMLLQHYFASLSVGTRITLNVYSSDNYNG